jgi:hypothetical protein
MATRTPHCDLDPYWPSVTNSEPEWLFREESKNVLWAPTEHGVLAILAALKEMTK